MNIESILRYYHTLRYVKPIQLRYQLFYRLRKKYRKFLHIDYVFSKKSESNSLKFQESIKLDEIFSAAKNGREFTFLNLTHSFDDAIDWNYSSLGKLWTYNLNYFDYLNQTDISKYDALRLMKDFVDNIKDIKDGLEPFPISLRGINWIKYLSAAEIKDKKIDDSLYAQYMILMDNLEYHLLGNHLLENGFSLLFGAYYFGDEHLLDKAKEILTEQMNEQILKDGAHFELTPMYHQIMLFRTLDCINLLLNNTDIFDEKELLPFLKEKAIMMLGWLLAITYRNGEVPHFNDSTNKIAPSSSQLFSYAARLGIEYEKSELKESGYRRFDTKTYELIADMGNIGPDYIPGHAHSDTFNFELLVDDKPVFVDTGISTYENNGERKLQRSTKAHNTVCIGDTDQSEVWSSFRVARRAKIVDFHQTPSSVKATHDGYKRFGLFHSRKFTAFEEKILIVDKIDSKENNLLHSIAYFHFHPDIKDMELSDNKIITDCVIVSFKGSKNIELVDIYIAKGYNDIEPAKCIKVTFSDKLETQINIVK